MARGTTGTVGLDMLVGFTTVIDYPAQRLCLTATADLPYPIYKDTDWTDAVLRDGKLFVPVTIGAQKHADFFFDTGASLFGLSVDGPDWKMLTGRSNMVGTRRIGGAAWGEKVELIGAPSAAPVAIAGLPARTVDVFYDKGTPARFGAYPFKADGLFGNAALWGRTIILTLGSHPQFGVLKRD